MTYAARPHLEQAEWEQLKCRTARHLSDPVWLGGSYLIVDRVPAGRLTGSTNEWEDARFCHHYVWGVGAR